MIPTPEQVVPLLGTAPEKLYNGLRKGISYADSLQPEPTKADPYFWAAGARFKALDDLKRQDDEGWIVRPGIPNCGIHLMIRAVHKARVVKAYDGALPSPGRSHRRNRDYVGVQGRFVYDFGDGLPLPALSLLLDWQLDAEREPIVHLSLPEAPWPFGGDPMVHWRVRLAPGGSLALSELVWNPGSSDDGDVMVTVPIDPSESDTAE